MTLLAVDDFTIGLLFWLCQWIWGEDRGRSGCVGECEGRGVGGGGRVTLCVGGFLPLILLLIVLVCLFVAVMPQFHT